MYWRKIYSCATSTQQPGKQLHKIDRCGEAPASWKYHFEHQPYGSQTCSWIDRKRKAGVTTTFLSHNCTICGRGCAVDIGLYSHMENSQALTAHPSTRRETRTSSSSSSLFTSVITDTFVRQSEWCRTLMICCCFCRSSRSICNAAGRARNANQTKFCSTSTRANRVPKDSLQTLRTPVGC